MCNISNKAELKAEQDKIVKLEAFYSSYFCAKSFWWLWFSKYVCLSTKI